MSNRTVLVLVDTPDDHLHPATLEAITMARSLGTVVALTTHPPHDRIMGQLSEYAVAAVSVATYVPAAAYADLSIGWGAAVAAACATREVSIVLAPATARHQEALAYAAHRTGGGLVVNAHRIALVDDALQVTSQPLAATWEVTSQIDIATPAFVTIRPNALSAQPAMESSVVSCHELSVDTTTLPKITVTARSLPHPNASGRPALDEAAIIVAGGRGTAGDFSPIFDLADALGAAVGATRDVVQEGWFDQFIGQTGVVVAPQVYIGAGISGAPHHRGGMQGSQVIIAVNNDPDCPLFDIADFAVVGDLAQVLPQAAAALRNRTP